MSDVKIGDTVEIVELNNAEDEATFINKTGVVSDIRTVTTYAVDTDEGTTVARSVKVVETPSTEESKQ